MTLRGLTFPASSGRSWVWRSRSRVSRPSGSSARIARLRTPTASLRRYRLGRRPIRLSASRCAGCLAADQLPHPLGVEQVRRGNGLAGTNVVERGAHLTTRASPCPQTGPGEPVGGELHRRRAGVGAGRAGCRSSSRPRSSRRRHRQTPRPSARAPRPVRWSSRTAPRPRTACAPPTARLEGAPQLLEVGVVGALVGGAGQARRRRAASAPASVLRASVWKPVPRRAHGAGLAGNGRRSGEPTRRGRGCELDELRHRQLGAAARHRCVAVADVAALREQPVDVAAPLGAPDPRRSASSSAGRRRPGGRRASRTVPQRRRHRSAVAPSGTPCRAGRAATALRAPGQERVGRVRLGLGPLVRSSAKNARLGEERGGPTRGLMAVSQT